MLMVLRNSKKMRFVKEPFCQDILTDCFKGNQAKCAAALGIPASYLSKLLKQETPKGGAALFGGLYLFCKQEGLNPAKYLLANSEKQEEGR